MPKGSKDKRNSTERRKDLLARRPRKPAMRPCTNCQSHRPTPRVCQLLPNCEKCVDCQRLGVPCDLVVTSADWDRIDREVSRLERELRETEERIAVDMAKTLRLRKQLKLQSEREQKLVARELQNIEDLERDEEQVNALPTSSDDLLSSLSPSFWESLVPPASQTSSAPQDN